MRLTRDCSVILHTADGKCRNAVLLQGQQFTQLWIRGEIVYVVCGGRFHAWHFVASDKWIRKNAEE